ncbi:MAG: BamA/TamA family outer membrane protein [bacterium]|nr:MAG: BamA/TamA family outer membrane protein [bacterium]
METWGEQLAQRHRTGVSLAPILVYEPTYGTLFGGAVFLDRPEEPRYRLHIKLLSSSESQYDVLFSLKKWDGSTFYHIDVEADDFARPYYGEGMDTSRSDQISMEGRSVRVQYYMRCGQGRRLTYGPFLDFRGVDPGEVGGTAIAPPEYEEASLALGLCLSHDVRDSQLSPTSGTFDTLSLRLVPDALTTFEGAHTFFQAEVDHRVIVPLGEGTVLAGRFHAGGSWGRPSYQFRYSLGGPRELRGFYTNRFRGDKFYTVTGEVRQDLFWIFSGAVFAEVGEASDDWFGSPETSWGCGFRFTLPPDHVAKARVDFAWARDQKSIYFIFGEAF